MPELPEVQTIVDDLNRKIIGRKIVNIWFDAPKLIKKPRLEEFFKQIKGLKIERIDRRGKNILIYLGQKSKVKSQKLLLIHQKLTGHLLVGRWRIKNNQPRAVGSRLLRERVNDYIHLIFYLDNGQMLALSDLRKFAKVLFGDREEIEQSPDLKKIGPEPLELKFETFKQLVSGKRGKIKQVLMDQEVIAGIGNIYSDDILWQAKIHPFKPAANLSNQEIKNLYQATRSILEKALRLRGTSTSDYRDTAGQPGNYTRVRLVYQREDEPCRRCKTPIKRIKLGGRSAHYCPKCQNQIF